MQRLSEVSMYVVKNVRRAFEIKETFEKKVSQTKRKSLIKHLTGQRHDKAMTAVALQKMPSCKLITPQEIALLDESSIQEDDDV